MGRSQYMKSVNNRVNPKILTVTTVSKMERNYIRGKIGQNNARILVDTGASISCIDIKFLEKMGIKRKALQQSDTLSQV